MRLILNVVISIFIKIALYILKSTENCFADNDKKHERGDFEKGN